MSFCISVSDWLIELLMTKNRWWSTISCAHMDWKFLRAKSRGRSVRLALWSTSTTNTAITFWTRRCGWRWLHGKARPIPYPRISYKQLPELSQFLATRSGRTSSRSMLVAVQSNQSSELQRKEDLAYWAMRRQCWSLITTRTSIACLSKSYMVVSATKSSMMRKAAMTPPPYEF